MTKEFVEVEVDYREPDGVWQAVDDHPEVEDAWMSEMDTGDLAIGPLLIERKTLGDYVDSMMGKMDRSLEDQAARMVQAVNDEDTEFKKAYVLVQGTPSDVENMRHTSVRPSSVRGSMAKLTALGVPVLSVCPASLLADNQPRAHRVFVDMAVRLARKEMEETELLHFSTGPVGPDQPTAKRMYGCIEGVGRETAQALYDHFPLPAQLANAELEEIMAVDGIGEKRAQKIREEFRLP